MGKWLARRAQLTTLLVATFVATLTGGYVNIATANLGDQGVGHLPVVLLHMGSWNLLMLAAAALLIAQYRVNRHAERRLSIGADDLIQEVLAAASRSIVFPHVNKHIRAIVTVRVGNTGQRVSRYAYNTAPDPERVASFPLLFGVTGEAYKTRSTVLMELPSNHVSTYEEEVQPLILPELRTVLAAPLLKSNDPRDEPLGVLAFDSVLTPEKLFLNKPEARQLAQSWADIIAKLLMVKDG
jgi:hypothetical protein